MRQGIDRQFEALALDEPGQMQNQQVADDFAERDGILGWRERWDETWQRCRRLTVLFQGVMGFNISFR